MRRVQGSGNIPKTKPPKQKEQTPLSFSDIAAKLYSQKQKIVADALKIINGRDQSFWPAIAERPDLIIEALEAAACKFPGLRDEAKQSVEMIRGDQTITGGLLTILKGQENDRIVWALNLLANGQRVENRDGLKELLEPLGAKGDRDIDALCELLQAQIAQVEKLPAEVTLVPILPPPPAATAEPIRPETIEVVPVTPADETPPPAAPDKPARAKLSLARKALVGASLAVTGVGGYIAYLGGYFFDTSANTFGPLLMKLGGAGYVLGLAAAGYLLISGFRKSVPSVEPIDLTPPIDLEAAMKTAAADNRTIFPGFVIVPAKTDTLGAIVPKGKILGHGAQSEVYEALNRDTGKRVAIKVYHQGTKVSIEYDAVRKINHENVVTVLQSATTAVGTQDLSYLVMEHISDPTMESLVGSTELAPAEKIRIALRVTDALAAAHGAGVFHRDIKPSQIFVGIEDGKVVRVKVGDFGLAKDITSDKDETTFGNLSGTFKYMAPHYIEYALMTAEEKAANKPRADKIQTKGEIYSVAATLYTLITGIGVIRTDGTRFFAVDNQRNLASHPQIESAEYLGSNGLADAFQSFKKAAGNPEAQTAILEANEVVVELFSPELAGILTRALSLDPASSYEDVRGLHEALQRHFDNLTANPEVVKLRNGSLPEPAPSSATAAAALADAEATRVKGPALTEPGEPVSEEVARQRFATIRQRIEDASDSVQPLNFDELQALGEEVVTLAVAHPQFGDRVGRLMNDIVALNRAYEEPEGEA
ncbi:MAG: serine/threonine-protein kinase [bacterium]